MAELLPCNRCNEEKPTSDFTRRRCRPRGYHYSCKECLAKVAKVYRATKKPSEEQKEAARIRSAKWRKANPEWASTVKADWGKRNRHMRNASNAKRRAAKLERTPSWLSEEHRKQMEDTYLLAREAQLLTGDPYHVDHIVPLQGDNISGLHVPWNLQVLPADLNMSKGKTYDG